MPEMFYYEMEDVKFEARYEDITELLDRLKKEKATLLEVANELRSVGGFKKRLTISERLQLKNYYFECYDISEPCSHAHGEPFRVIEVYGDML